MDRKSKILIVIFVLLLIGSVGLTLYKYWAKDYQIYGFAPCDPQTESCFYYPCEEGDDSCNPDEIEYYKKVEKTASNTELCDPNNEGCNPLVCGENENDCYITLCSEDALEEGEACSEIINNENNEETNQTED
jgi:hypothetical protein